MTVGEALATGTRLLKEAGIDSAARDARRLMAALLEVEPGRLTLHAQDALDPLVEPNFISAIQERKTRRPMSHLLGYRDFYGRQFDVSSDVLDPRGDTETLIEAALQLPFERLLDLGTGSGCILLTLLAECPGATGVGTDISEAALAVATRNMEKIGVTNRTRLVQSDWFAAVTGSFDLIVSNPPYIAAHEMAELQSELSFEPRIALTDEEDGLSAYRTIVAQATGFLNPGGTLMMEIGATQGQQVHAIFAKNGFTHISVLPDLEGRDRLVSGQLSPSK